ncbi:MAG: hypothetical protein KF699_00020 [Phycisphaeraceae bacterium]|nr:hypothetical protein [Phycisphaeraceae bacterium]MBX3406751.1 hypothetical protein [Phycisphaeraceae bacterium]
MITRVLTILLLALTAASSLPWRVVCAPGCCESFGGSCQTVVSAMPGASSCCASSCCDEPVALCAAPVEAQQAGGLTCAAHGGACCCVFVPSRPCTGCDLFRFVAWAPWKNERAEISDFASGQWPLAAMGLPRAPEALGCRVPTRPPWRPSGPALLSHICMLTI